MLHLYRDMTTEDLVDLLAQKTQRFTQLMMDKEFTYEYAKCKRIIEKIQEVIESRSETRTPPRPSSTPPDSTA